MKDAARASIFGDQATDRLDLSDFAPRPDRKSTSPDRATVRRESEAAGFVSRKLPRYNLPPRHPRRPAAQRRRSAGAAPAAISSSTSRSIGRPRTGSTASPTSTAGSWAKRLSTRSKRSRGPPRARKGRAAPREVLDVQLPARPLATGCVLYRSPRNSADLVPGCGQSRFRSMSGAGTLPIIPRTLPIFSRTLPINQESILIPSKVGLIGKVRVAPGPAGVYQQEHTLPTRGRQWARSTSSSSRSARSARSS